MSTASIGILVYSIAKFFTIMVITVSKWNTKFPNLDIRTLQLLLRQRQMQRAFVICLSGTWSRYAQLPAVHGKIGSIAWLSGLERIKQPPAYPVCRGPAVIFCKRPASEDEHKATLSLQWSLDTPSTGGLLKTIVASGHSNVACLPFNIHCWWSQFRAISHSSPTAHYPQIGCPTWICSVQSRRNSKQCLEWPLIRPTDGGRTTMYGWH